MLGGADNPDFGGGLGQRPDPTNFRGIATPTAGYTGVPEGGLQEVCRARRDYLQPRYRDGCRALLAMRASTGYGQQESEQDDCHRLW